MQNIYLIIGIILVSIMITTSLFKKKEVIIKQDLYCPIVIKPSFDTIADTIGSIDIKPVGCYTNIKGLFFTSCINPYSTSKIQDSGIFISNYPNDMVTLIKRVIDNGYDLYGNKILNKYNSTDYSDLDLLEIATLGYLTGYRFMSIYKTDNSNFKQIFFSYSQPMNSNETLNDFAKPDLNGYTLTPKLNGYRNENENSPEKELSCGFPCLKNGKAITFKEGDVTKQYMCGSVVYPTIKTPPRYAVYEIFEKEK